MSPIGPVNLAPPRGLGHRLGGRAIIWQQPFEDEGPAKPLRLSRVSSRLDELGEVLVGNGKAVDPDGVDRDLADRPLPVAGIDPGVVAAAQEPAAGKQNHSVAGSRIRPGSDRHGGLGRCPALRAGGAAGRSRRGHVTRLRGFFAHRTSAYPEVAIGISPANGALLGYPAIPPTVPWADLPCGARIPCGAWRVAPRAPSRTQRRVRAPTRPGSRCRSIRRWW